MSASFLFYDLETFGTDPRRTRIAQFAAIRTDAELVEIEAPIDVLVQPANDLLPSPAATLVTGITPQRALHDGIPEAAAFARIAEAMSVPETCTLGYNTLRFDDEFIRYGLYRNFHDPYAREWRDGNSRWDLLDVTRLMHALRPDGVCWRAREDGGGTSFKLEHLAEDNGLREGHAHEALSDVRASIGLARRMRSAQPRLWNYALKLRDKRFAASLLDPIAMRPVLHISQRYAASRLCAAPVLPLSVHPRYGNRIIVLDLHHDPAPLLELDHEAIAMRVFTAQSALPEGTSRIGLKEVHLNRAPILIDWTHLRAADFDRLGIDPELVESRAARLRPHAAALAEKVRRVRASVPEQNDMDPDAALYAGFIPQTDLRLFPHVRATPPQLLGQAGFAFRDSRLDGLLFRYRARNWPQTLQIDEHARWNAYRRERLFGDGGLGEFNLACYREDIATLRTQHAGDTSALVLLDALEALGNDIEGELA